MNKHELNNISVAVTLSMLLEVTRGNLGNFG